MSDFDYFSVHIEFRDGTEQTIDYASREIVAEGVLSLYIVNNTHTREAEHIGSWPLDTIKEWKRKSRW